MAVPDRDFRALRDVEQGNARAGLLILPIGVDAHAAGLRHRDPAFVRRFRNQRLFHLHRALPSTTAIALISISERSSIMRESSTMVEAGRSTGKNHPIAGTYNGRPSSQKKKTATAVSTADGLRRHSSLSAPRDND